MTVEAGKLRQTKYLQTGSGFPRAAFKELFFVGENDTPVRASIRWPGGTTQQFEKLPVSNRIEVEEGSDTFSARPFGVTPAIYSRPATSPPIEPLPLQTATWLIEPLKAPEFSLPDLAGKPVELKSISVAASSC